MVKTAAPAYSRYSREAIALLGQLIRRSRIERKVTIAELGERAGVSRGLVRRIEAGDPGCSIGAVFEAAAILGIKFFDADQSTLSARLSETAQVLRLLPRSVRASARAVEDDF